MDALEPLCTSYTCTEIDAHRTGVLAVHVAICICMLKDETLQRSVPKCTQMYVAMFTLVRIGSLMSMRMCG